MSSLGYHSTVLVHDWLTGMRGGEKVLEALCELFPDAPLYTLLHRPGSVSSTIEDRPIVTSPLQHAPLSSSHYRYYLPLLPMMIESLRLPEAELVVSTSSCVAKGIVPPWGARHASYVHTPMRYLYDRYDDYFSKGKTGVMTRSAMALARPWLRRWDIASTARVDDLVANSTFVAHRIRQCYGRSARVIFPPVDGERFARASRTPEDYYLVVSALVPYKNVEVAVEAFSKLDRPLRIAGSGPLFARLSARATSNVRFLGWVPDEELPHLVAGCRAFLMPNVEDFGIAPVEAMAAGRPVIARAEGGVLDTVLDPAVTQIRPPRMGELQTGVLYHGANSSDLLAAVKRFESEEHLMNAHSIKTWAHQFSKQRFKREISDWLGGLFHSSRRRAA